MTKVLQNYVTLVTELKLLQDSNGKRQIEGGELNWPQFLSVGKNRTLDINNNMSKAISSIARVYWNNNPSLKKRIRLKEWSAQTRRLFGNPLSKLDLNAPDIELATILREQIDDAMKKAALPQSWALEHVFATTWLLIKTFESYEFGPIRLETRELWLDRMLKIGNIDKVSHRRVKSYWAGNKLRKRKPGLVPY